jgi:hypothetical protein
MRFLHSTGPVSSSLGSPPVGSRDTWEGASYNPETGEVAFVASEVYRDAGGQDEFTWNVGFTVLAIG